MSHHLTQLTDTLARHFDDAVAQQTVKVAEAWLGGSTGLPEEQAGPVDQALAAGVLVKSKGFVYLARSYAQEQAVAHAITQRLDSKSLDPEQIAALDTLAAQGEYALNTEQRSAIDLPLTGSFGLLLGGPGTGKSTVIQRMAEGFQALVNANARIGLCAPTGKAAARLNGLVEGVQPTTLARMERSLREGVVLDLLIVDEASMIDLENAQRLFALLADTTRLVLIGDPEQLDSVEPGSIMAELAHCPALATRTRHLTQTYRFSEQTPLGRLATAIRACDASAVQAEFQAVACSQQALVEQAIEAYSKLHSHNPEQYLASLSEYQLLCATRVGWWGSQAVNQRISQALAARGLIAPELGDGWVVMVTQNQPALGLANGDVGVVQGQDLVTEAGTVPLHLVQSHEPAWAMTVHKSQGSEYQEVGVLLSDGAPLSKALIYTAVTRAKQAVQIGGDWNPGLLAARQRTSGLARHIGEA